jgi:group I intron endonuclease
MENLYTTKNLNKRYNKSGIYLLQIGNRYYVGSSVSIGNRLATHRSRLKRNKHENIIMINCFNKYGEEQSHFKVLEECDISILLEREKFYIDTLKPELNIELNPVLQNSEYKSKTVYQYSLNGEYIKSFKGASEAERTLDKNSNKISQCCLNKRKSAYNYLWSYTKVEKLLYQNNSSKAKIKSVIQYNLQGEMINIYESAAEAVRDLKLQGSFKSNCTFISACCLNKTKTAFGYVWEHNL